MPEQDHFRPFITPAATAHMVTTCMASFNALDVRDLARYGKVTPPLDQFLKLMREQSGKGFRILRNGDDLIILDEDGQPTSTFPAGPDDGVWALVKMGLATWDEGGMLQLAEHPPDHRLNLAPARRVPDESRPGLRVDFEWGSNDNDF